MLSRAIGVVILKLAIRTYGRVRLRLLLSQLRLKLFTTLSFVNSKAHWLVVENSVTIFQSSLLATHPDKGLNIEAH